jgi:outer membrane protein TolC
MRGKKMSKQKTKSIFIPAMAGLFSLVLSVLCAGSTADGEALTAAARSLSVEEFLRIAAEKDTRFEQILIEELSLQYQKDLRLPARDLVLSVKSGYSFIFDQERKEPDIAVGLSKLFPFAGTKISVTHTSTPRVSSNDHASELDFSISQPIAQNAFGRSTRMLDSIIGIEIDVARHQIIEAYEDYFATLIAAYYTWYQAYENLQIGRSSYKENVKLLDNIKERQASKIALPIDVNKTSLQVLTKHESLIRFVEEYDSALTVIKNAMRYDGGAELIPIEPVLYKEHTIDFDADFARLKTHGRTFLALRLLEEKSTLDVARSADSLLPSIDLKLGYTLSGDEFDFEDSDSVLFAGITLEFPFPDQVDRAQKKIDTINRDKQYLITNNVYYRLYNDLRAIAFAVRREEALLKIADERILLAAAVLEAEAENYSFGKVTLNDYIAAVNRYDDARFNRISRRMLLKKLKLEWLRLSDELVQKSDIIYPRYKERMI